MAKRKAPGAPRAGKSKSNEGAAAGNPGPVVATLAEFASGDAKRDVMDRLVAADKKAAEAKKSQTSSNLSVGKIMKEAVKTTGFDKDALQWFLKNRDREPDDIVREAQRQAAERNKVATFMNMPLNGQTTLGLNEDGSSVASHTPTEREARLDNDPAVLDAIEAQGQQAGRDGASFTTNPAPAGSKRALRWAAGWKTGQKDNVPGATKAPTHESAHV